jgi:hydroxymethylpyrimidine/phosphomethylpyrimidine kinase
LETRSPLGRRKLHIRAVDPSIVQNMLAMILHREELTKLAVGVLQGKDMIETILRRLRKMMANFEESIA